VIGLGIAGLGLVWLFSQIANNPRVSPNLRFVALTAEGQVMQDLETGLFHLLA
jgi:hypothetical protein